MLPGVERPARFESDVLVFLSFRIISKLTDVSATKIKKREGALQDGATLLGLFLNPKGPPLW